MTRTLSFCMVHRKLSEITNKKPIFSQYNFFYNYEYFFFQSAFWSLFNYRQRSQSNQKQCSLCCSSPCFLVLLPTHYGPLHAFQHIFVIKRNRSFTSHISRLCYFLWLCSSQVYTLKHQTKNLHVGN